jgi:hypothetical protein
MFKRRKYIAKNKKGVLINGVKVEYDLMVSADRTDAYFNAPETWRYLGTSDTYFVNSIEQRRNGHFYFFKNLHTDV